MDGVSTISLPLLSRDTDPLFCRWPLALPLLDMLLPCPTDGTNVSLSYPYTDDGADMAQFMWLMELIVSRKCPECVLLVLLMYWWYYYWYLTAKMDSCQAPLIGLISIEYCSAKEE